MLYRLLAHLVLAAHLAFILFAVLGGLVALRRPRAAWLHLPVAAWAVLIEYAGWYCPLTDLENLLLHKSGESGYAGGFMEHYLLPLIYPAGLTRPVQLALGTLVLALNLGIYGWLWQRARAPKG